MLNASQHPHVKENHACKAACCKGRNHSYLEAENGNGGSHRKQECQGIDARKLRCIEHEQESAHRLDFVEDRVDGEPDREVENDAGDSGRDCRERRGQGFSRSPVRLGFVIGPSQKSSV